MARIRQKDTAPELIVRRLLHAAGLRYRLHVQNLPGRPDLVFPKYRVVVFVHGCYWHGHSCRAGRTSTTNVEYWGPKIAENRARDVRKAAELETLAWRVLTVWECEIKGPDTPQRVARIAEAIRAPYARRLLEFA